MLKQNQKTQQGTGSEPVEKRDKSAGMKRTSAYGRQLQKNKKLNICMGCVSVNSIVSYEEASNMQGVPGENLLSLLERRLDNVVYRLKMATTLRKHVKWLYMGILWLMVQKLLFLHICV